MTNHSSFNTNMYVQRFASILIYFPTLIIAENFSSEKTSSTTETAGLESENEFSVCESKVCVPKCCVASKHVYKRRKCVSYNSTRVLDFSDTPVYDNNVDYIVETVKEGFHLVPREFYNVDFNKAFELSTNGLRNYLTEDGTLYLEFPNAFRRWTVRNRSQYCLDYQLPIRNMTTPEPRYWVILDTEIAPATNPYYITSAMLVSCVFLALVLATYFALPELRNVCGLILMSYVTSQLLAFLLLAALQLLSAMELNYLEICLWLSLLIYYFFLATFCWMNVMSFDIWWTFRSYTKARLISRKGRGRNKFLLYCAYAWIVPLLMTIALAILNEIDLSHIPWFITPKIPKMGCFLEGGEKLVYLYTPMLIMILFNWLFYLLTAYHVWRLSRGTGVLNEPNDSRIRSQRRHKTRFMVYIKLSVIMGVSWVLEVISSLKPELQFWYISDSYNLLIGLSIFLIFVCKKKIYVKLVKKFRGEEIRNLNNRVQSSVTTQSDDSQDVPLHVCYNPKGSTHETFIPKISRKSKSYVVSCQ